MPSVPVATPQSAQFADEDDLNFLSTKAAGWSQSGASFMPSERFHTKLPVGFYTADRYNGCLTHTPIKENRIVDLPDSVADEVIQSVRRFWNQEDKYNVMGLTFKRGIILHGPPGTGKSCTLQKICLDTIKHNKGVVLRFSNTPDFEFCYKMVRHINPEAPILVVIEEMDEYKTTQLMNVMDGMSDVHKVVFLATTNHIEELAGPFLRPSRFDDVIMVGPSEPATRRIFLQDLFDNCDFAKDADLDKWVEDTEGFTIATLKELFISVNIADKPYEESLTRLKEFACYYLDCPEEIEDNG